MMELLIKLVVAHILGDFAFQNKTISEKKLTEWRYLALHILIVFSAFLICTIGHHSWSLIGAMFTIAFLHVVDRCKRGRDSLTWFIIDQAFHLISIAIIPAFFGIWDISLIFGMVSGFYSNALIWIYILGYSTGIFGGKVLIDKFMNSIEKDNTKFSPLGDKIGIIERLIVITFALHNQYTAIGIVFAIKGVARKVYAEENGELYFLGTGLSFFIAILSALIINWLKGFIV